MQLYDSVTRRRPAWTTTAVLAITFCLAVPVARAVSRQEQRSIQFADATAAAGLDFVHFSGRSAEKHMPETMGGGVLWQDFDGDGRGDIYLVDSGPYEDVPPLATAGTDSGRNAYYRATDSGDYRASEAGIGDRGFGQGAAAADFDADGFVDLYVTNYGADALYRNNGDGSFANVTDEFGLGDERWGTSAAWGDLDLDGFADLYVANYLVYSQANARVCGDVANDLRGYCTPELFEGVHDILYRNLAGAGFEDVAVAAGVANALDGKGLGVVIADFDRDDLPDLYVANDATRNFVFMNQGQMQFEDVGLMSGAGLGVQGLPQSGMGVDAGDLDGDGLPEIGVTNYEQQPVNMYRALAPGFFAEDSFSIGLGGPTAMMLGFGIVFVDADGDGDPDVFIANGHALDTAARYAQPNQVFLNQRRERWREHDNETASLLLEVSAEAGAAFTSSSVSRGMAAGDIEGDGWPDLIVSNIDAAPQLLRNTTPRDNHRLVLRLRGRATNRDGFGARVTVTSTDADGREYEQHLESKSSTSYVSQSVNELYVGLADWQQADLRVRWPGGQDEHIGVVDTDQALLIVEGSGVVAARPLIAPE